MKRCTVLNGGLWAAVFLGFLTASCGKSVLDEDRLSPGGAAGALVRIQTRSAVGDGLEYPLRVMAFSDDGALQDDLTVEGPEDDAILYLAQGVGSHIVALSAPKDMYQVEETPSLESVVTMIDDEGPDDCVAVSPLQMGFADVLPRTESISAKIQMYYKVAWLEVSLSGLPEECQSVWVSVWPASGSVSLRGDAGQECTARFECRRNGDVWRSGTVYVFPGSGQQTNLSIAWSDGNDEHVSSVTYLAPLKAGVPYSLNGLYTDGSVQVSGDFSWPEWSKCVSIDFSFGPDLNTVIDGVSDDADAAGDAEGSVSSIPALLSVWNGHLVVKVDAVSDTEAALTLLSLSDWDDVTSATNAETPEMAGEITAFYTEYGLDSWRIPTETEARELMRLCKESGLEGAMLVAKGDAIAVTDDKGNNIQYLCGEALKKFNFKGVSVSPVGAKVLYHLRLVRTVTVTISQ